MVAGSEANREKASACVPAIRSTTTHYFGFDPNLSRYRVKQSRFHQQKTPALYKKAWSLGLFICSPLSSQMCSCLSSSSWLMSTGRLMRIQGTFFNVRQYNAKNKKWHSLCWKAFLKLEKLDVTEDKLVMVRGSNSRSNKHCLQNYFCVCDSKIFKWSKNDKIMSATL